MMIEGEEECGSKNLFGFVRDNADEFKRDLALVCDTSMWDAEDAGDHHLAARAGLRGGAAHLRRPRPAFRAVRRRGAESDPRARAKSLRRCTTTDGRVTIPGFYDGVRELPADIKADLAGLDLTPEKFLGQVGLKIPAGEKDRMLIEQIVDAADRRGQRHHRRLYRRGREDRHPGQGDGQGVVPPGRRAGPEEDPRGVPRLRARAPAGRLHGRVRQFHQRAGVRSAVRQPGARPRRARRSPTNGARRP